MKELKKMTPCGVPRAREIMNVKSDAAIYQKVSRGQIPYRKIGSKVVFFEEELIALIDGSPGLRLEEMRVSHVSRKAK